MKRAAVFPRKILGDVSLKQMQMLHKLVTGQVNKDMLPGKVRKFTREEIAEYERRKQ